MIGILTTSPSWNVGRPDCRCGRQDPCRRRLWQPCRYRKGGSGAEVVTNAGAVRSRPRPHVLNWTFLHVGMVEAAGVEPASEKDHRREPNMLSSFVDLDRRLGTNKPSAIQPD